MKYMGSKRWMLSNGLGSALLQQSRDAGRFVDLFAGSAAVACFVAEKVDVAVLAVDLQTYSTVLADAVLLRTRPLDESVVRRWIRRARADAGQVEEPDEFKKVTKRMVIDMRKRAGGSTGLLAQRYGGHYFSLGQATALDALIARLPRDRGHRAVCLASVVEAATRCSASPGHTAQPFGPTKTALPFITTAWRQDPFVIATEVGLSLSARYAKTAGSSVVADAVAYAQTSVDSSDVVFIDPPYSAVQYSRFYHVLETIARGSCGPVSGVGRYPSREERPTSRFSQKGLAPKAMDELLGALGQKRCTAVLTFPQHGCSNGVTGEELISAARKWFEVDVMQVAMRHSTLGGNNASRASRRRSTELVLTMTPRKLRARAAIRVTSSTA